MASLALPQGVKVAHAKMAGEALATMRHGLMRRAIHGPHEPGLMPMLAHSVDVPTLPSRFAEIASAPPEIGEAMGIELAQLGG